MGNVTGPTRSVVEKAKKFAIYGHEAMEMEGGLEIWKKNKSPVEINVMAKLCHLNEFIEREITGFSPVSNQINSEQQSRVERRPLSDNCNFSSESAIWRRAVELELSRGAEYEAGSQTNSFSTAEKLAAAPRSAKK